MANKIIKQKIKNLAKGDLLHHIKYGKLTVEKVIDESIYVKTVTNGTRCFLINDDLINELTNIISDDNITINEFDLNDQGCLVRFNNSSNIVNEKIVLPDGIVKIGRAAFKGCNNLVEIIVPESINEIGDEAFRDCTKLKKINIPEEVKNIGEAAFLNCSSLEEINILSRECFIFRVNGFLV